MNRPQHPSNPSGRARIHDVALVLLGVAALVLKERIGNGLIQSYGGNVTASFSTYFVLKLPLDRSRFRVALAAVLALLATGLFEATDGFGFMSNTYDPADYLANAIGVALGVGVDGLVRLAARRGRGVAAGGGSTT